MPAPWQSTLAAHHRRLFVSKLKHAPDKKGLLYSTYLGGQQPGPALRSRSIAPPAPPMFAILTTIDDFPTASPYFNLPSRWGNDAFVVDNGPVGWEYEPSSFGWRPLGICRPSTLGYFNLTVACRPPTPILPSARADAQYSPRSRGPVGGHLQPRNTRICPGAPNGTNIASRLSRTTLALGRAERYATFTRVIVNAKRPPGSGFADGDQHGDSGPGSLAARRSNANAPRGNGPNQITVASIFPHPIPRLHCRHGRIHASPLHVANAITRNE